MIFLIFFYHRALERETQKEREKNRSHFLLLEMKRKRMKNPHFSLGSSIISSSSTKTNQTDENIKGNKNGSGNKKKLSVIEDIGSVESCSTKGTPKQTPKKNLNRKDFSPTDDSDIEYRTKGKFNRLFFNVLFNVFFYLQIHSVVDVFGKKYLLIFSVSPDFF